MFSFLMTLMAGFVQNTEYYEKLVELSLQLFQFFSYSKAFNMLNFP